VGQLGIVKDLGKREKALIYLRVSTEEQVENYSLATQEDICKKEAERRDYEIDHIFREEGRSAKTIQGRPVLIEMLAYCKSHKKDISAIIVYRLDRISRQTADYLAIRKKLAECDVKLISATEPTGNSPTEKFVETMLAGFAQMDNDVRSERARNGMKARFLMGLPNGYIPMGYINQNGYATKDPDTFDKIKAAWELVGTGTVTLRQMARILTEQGVRQRNRKPVENQALARMFKNKFYCGKIYSVKHCQEVQGQHPPMVTEELFYRVQAVLEGRNVNVSAPLAKKNRDNPDFPLRRIVKCSCGQSFTGARSTSRSGDRFAYYFCQKRCGAGPSVPLKKLDDATVELLKEISLTSKGTEAINTLLRETYFQRTATLKKRIAQADSELRKQFEMRQSLVEKNLMGVYSDEIFKEQNRIVEDRIRNLQYTKNDELIGKYDLEKITQFITDKLGNLAQTYKNSNLDQIRVLLCSIFPFGIVWDYTRYSNTKKSPFYQAFLDFQSGSAMFGG
jgi:site-specific DNA recombinase